MKPLKIGNVTLKNPIILAPMVDVTDLPYRIICRRAGAGMAYTEMLNIGAILHENKKTQNMLFRIPVLFGADQEGGIINRLQNIKGFKTTRVPKIPYIAPEAPRLEV